MYKIGLANQSNIKKWNNISNPSLLCMVPARTYKDMYRPKINIQFASSRITDEEGDEITSTAGGLHKATDGRYYLYHSDGGENYMKWLTRINVLFIVGNSALLALELLNPCKLSSILRRLFTHQT